MNVSMQDLHDDRETGDRLQPCYEDPLDQDCSADAPVPATRRGLTRLALIAAETGARFQRDGEGRDPMGWLLAPRRLFHGGAAIDAVLAREGFMRALLLHGLSLGLDAEPAFIDGLVVDEGYDDFEPDGRGRESTREEIIANCGTRDDDAGGWFASPREPDAARWSHLSPQAAEDAGSERRPRLFTATLVHHDGRGTLHVFHASVCREPLEAYYRLVSRFGREAASEAELCLGFDPTTTFAEALVSPAMSELLQLIDESPEGSLAAGLDLTVEQRFEA